MLEAVYGDPADEVTAFLYRTQPWAPLPDNATEQEINRQSRTLVVNGLDEMQSLKERLPWVDVPPTMVSAPFEGAATRESETSHSDAVAAVDPSGPIFVVHGHDETALARVQLAVERGTRRDAEILREGANGGRTLIEKLEQHAQQIAYAIVLLTADDVGGKRSSEGNLAPRARQNVVFEMGFFYGLIGRSRVAVVFEAGVELPSDVGGIAYIELDSAGAWKMELATELEHAQIAVDGARMR